ncbi:Gfo/Idh/MocA family protein [Paenibacillus sp. WC2504]|uniref:Gfo/Idh/MocA family protein n=1 Tax=Paenibacillus sp. WC2504 TaxID=3461403 RepID=UPI004045EC74
MKKIRVAIIGQGRSGRDIHANSLSQMKEQYEIVAVADMLEERLERAKKELNCDVYRDYKDLFKRNDRGFHVLSEKPLARTAHEVDILIDKAMKTGKLLAIFQQSRYAPAYRQVQENIKSSVIGQVVQVNIAYNNFARRSWIARIRLEMPRTT